MSGLFVLAQKETRQNAVLFAVPAAIFAALVFIDLLHAPGIPGRYVDLLATALPVALAAAFGLQAFDAEENAQTKDFLLTKPVSPGQVVAVKYLVGLIALLAISVLGEIFLLPEAVRPPSLADYSTLWFYSYLFLVLVVHVACFAVAAYVKGPRKVLYGALFAVLAAGWFLTGFFGLLTALYHSFGDPGLWWSWAGIGLGMLLLLYLMAFFLKIATWSIHGVPAAWVRRSLLLFVAGLVFFPVGLQAAACSRQPAIRPFASLFRTFFGGEEWFVGTTAVKCPGKDLYALADDHGRLAIAVKGGRPELVYAGKKGESSPQGGKNEEYGSSLSSLAFSPDGRWLTFVEDEIVKAYDTQKKELVPVLQGDLAVWATDPKRMLVLRKEKNGNTYHLSVADFNRRVGIDLGAFDLAGLAVGWDAARERRLLLGPEGLLLFSLETKRSTLVPFRPALPGGLAITGGRILPPRRPDKPYRLVLFALPPGRKGFDAYLYDYDPVREVIEGLPPLRGLGYKELVFDPESREVLGHLGMGVYRVVAWKEETS
ncbi:MAG: ABC transporter permease subunit [Firmicutes bacterium]|nr:ABC transporter permease subunit [Bacillota bacterium]